MDHDMARMPSRVSRRLLALATLAGLSAAGVAPAATLGHVVSATDNLFFEDWGHGFTGAIDIRQPEPGGVDVGTPARAVRDADGAFDFSGFEIVEITASGAIRDLNMTFTGPGGADDPEHRYPFRGALVYSLIGIWSASPDSIVPVAPLVPPPVFDIGASATLAVPTIAGVYLFLGENDGVFSDNVGEYTVSLTAGFAPVPLPAPGLMLGAGLATLLARARRHALAVSR